MGKMRTGGNPKRMTDNTWKMVKQLRAILK